MLCNGNQTEFCGGSNRLNVYDYQMQFVVSSTSASGSSATTSSVVGTTSVISSTDTAIGVSSRSATSSIPAGTGFPTGWSSQGCWVDGAQGRILSFQAADSATMTPQSCASTCNSAGYIVSGTEYSTQCFCGNGIVNNGTQAPASDCNMPCGGDATQDCGAGNRLSIVSKGAPVAIAPPAPIQQVGSWTYQGCYTDNVNQVRTFPQQIIFQNMTPATCLDRCAEFGFMAAGIEYGDECYCE